MYQVSVWRYVPDRQTIATVCITCREKNKSLLAIWEKHARSVRWLAFIISNVCAWYFPVATAKLESCGELRRAAESCGEIWMITITETVFYFRFYVLSSWLLQLCCYIVLLALMWGVDIEEEMERARNLLTCEPLISLQASWSAQTTPNLRFASLILPVVFSVYIKKK